MLRKKSFFLLIVILLAYGCSDNSTGTKSGNSDNSNNDKPPQHQHQNDDVLNGNVAKLKISNPDNDYIYAFVNGVKKRLWHNGTTPSGKFDISSWFTGQADTLFFRVVNSQGTAYNEKSGQSDYTIQLYLDNKLEYQRTCADPSNGCTVGENMHTGTVFKGKKVFKLNNGNEGTLSINGPSGYLYINNYYTGKAVPTSLDLASGTYKIGIGTYGQDPHYYEKDVTINGSNKNFTLDSSDKIPTRDWKIGLLPVRYTTHLNQNGNSVPSNFGYLQDSRIPEFKNHLAATNIDFVHPNTYNLINWDITRLPTVESDTLVRGYQKAPDTNGLLEKAGLDYLHDQYDVIVFLYAHKTENGNDVNQLPCCGWGGGDGMSITYFGDNFADDGLYHEFLHVVGSYDSYYRYHRYIGLLGTHGAAQHGIPDGYNNEFHYNYWYRIFSRSQVKEVQAMRANSTYKRDGQVLPADSPDLYTGVFYTIRYGPDGSLPFSNAKDKLNKSSNPPLIYRK